MNDLCNSSLITIGDMYLKPISQFFVPFYQTIPLIYPPRGKSLFKKSWEKANPFISSTGTPKFLWVYHFNHREIYNSMVASKNGS